MSEMKALQLLNSIEKDQDWLQSNLNKLKNEYDSKFVAIKDGRVVAVGSLIEEVIQKLKLQKIDPSETLIEYISKMAIVL